MFVVRLASGVVLLAVAALLFWFGGFPFAIVLCLISCIGYRELLNAMFYKKDENKRAEKCPEIIGYAAYSDREPPSHCLQPLSLDWLLGNGRP